MYQMQFESLVFLGVRKPTTVFVVEQGAKREKLVQSGPEGRVLFENSRPIARDRRPTWSAPTGPTVFEFIIRRW